MITSICNLCIIIASAALLHYFDRFIKEFNFLAISSKWDVGLTLGNCQQESQLPLSSNIFYRNNCRNPRINQSIVIQISPIHRVKFEVTNIPNLTEKKIPCDIMKYIVSNLMMLY